MYWLRPNNNLSEKNPKGHGITRIQGVYIIYIIVATGICTKTADDWTCLDALYDGYINRSPK